MTCSHRTAMFSHSHKIGSTAFPPRAGFDAHLAAPIVLPEAEAGVNRAASPRIFKPKQTMGRRESGAWGCWSKTCRCSSGWSSWAACPPPAATCACRRPWSATGCSSSKAIWASGCSTGPPARCSRPSRAPRSTRRRRRCWRRWPTPRAWRRTRAARRTAICASPHRWAFPAGSWRRCCHAFSCSTRSFPSACACPTICSTWCAKPSTSPSGWRYRPIPA